MSTTNTPGQVTVIGLGPMGQAMARALLAAGRQATVWNRTPSRADDLVAEGATRAETPADAVRAAELVILSLTDYQAMYDILGNVDGTVLAGKVIVNLSSDSPERTREAADWAGNREAQFVTGGVMVPAPMVGTDDAYVYYSGPKEAVEAHELTLRIIGSPRFLGEDPGLAQLFYQAHLDVFLTTLSALIHATALVTAAGASAADFIPDAIGTITGTPAMIGDSKELVQELESGVYPGDLSNVTMMGATADHIVAVNAVQAAAHTPRTTDHRRDACSVVRRRRAWPGRADASRGRRAGDHHPCQGLMAART